MTDDLVIVLFVGMGTIACILPVFTLWLDRRLSKDRKVG